MCHFLVVLLIFPSPQCLNAVRTVQSLACLDEADHTVGFLLQLSSFCKEWQFHLPNLLRDVQASPEESCTPAEITPQLHWYSHLLSISLSLSVSSVQVNLCYLCQTCTYLLHSKKMLHHYLQVSYSYGCITTKNLADARKKLLNIAAISANDFMFILEFLRLKMVRRYPLLLYQRHNGRPKLHLKRWQVEGRERKLSRRPCWLCSAVF